MIFSLGAAAALALLALVSTSAGAAPMPIEVTATPLPKFDLTGQTRFGALDYRGGMVLASPSKAFGGISGMVLSADGVGILAITDKGMWLAGRIDSEGDRPVGLADMTMTPMLGDDGRTLSKIGRGDVESLVRTADGYIVGIERIQEIWSFAGIDPRLSRGKKLVSGGELSKLENNSGLEALMAGPFGIIAVAEHAPDDPKILPGFLFTPLAKPAPIGRFVIDRIDGFDATDMALADDGMVYLLERRFDLMRGQAMRIRRFPLAEIKPGAVIKGEVLIEANRLASIDNMEAMAIHRNPAGELILTLLSDDNFSAWQRTIMLRFAVVQ